MKPQFTINDIDWKYASRNVDDDFHTDIVFLRISTSTISNFCGCSYRSALLHYNDFTGQFYYPHDEAKTVCDALVQRLISYPRWADILNAHIIKRSDRLRQLWVQHVGMRPYSGASVAAILRTYRRQLDAQKRLYEVAFIPEILQDEAYGMNVYLRKYLRSKLVRTEECDAVTKVMSSGHPRSVYKMEASALIGLAKRIIRSPDLFSVFREPLRYIRFSLPASVVQELRTLSDAYGYLGYHGYGSRRPYDQDDYLERVWELVNNKQMLRNAAASLEPYDKERKIRCSYARRLGIDKMHQKIFSVYGDFAITKAYRRLAQLKNFHFLDLLIEEIALRLDVPEKWVRFMAPEEIESSLRDCRRLPRELEARSQQMIFIIRNCEEKILTGERAAQFAARLAKRPLASDGDCLVGSMACGGYAVGRALLVKRPSEVKNVVDRNPFILVSQEADPDLFVLARRAAAIVTDQGGITCHAAILAREFNIPCVVGTHRATQLISQGDLVEVNAAEGRVRIRPSVATNARPKPR